MQNPRLQNLFAFLQADPQDAFTLYSIAYEYAAQDEHKTAVQYFRQLRSLHPDYTGLYLHLGRSLRALGLEDEAIATLQEGVAVATRVRDMHAKGELLRELEGD